MSYTHLTSHERYCIAHMHAYKMSIRTNENTNGLLRRSFPKGCNFHEISDKVIKQVIEKLNHQPRKCLNFRTPYEVLFKTKTVALRT